MLTIQEVATMAGLHRDTVRRLEKRGLISSQRDINNWRRYAPDVVDKLKQLYAASGSEHAPPEALSDGR